MLRVADICYCEVHYVSKTNHVRIYLCGQCCFGKKGDNVEESRWIFPSFESRFDCNSTTRPKGNYAMTICHDLHGTNENQHDTFSVAIYRALFLPVMADEEDIMKVQ